jgi:hypothetical protein
MGITILTDAQLEDHIVKFVWDSGRPVFLDELILDLALRFDIPPMGDDDLRSGKHANVIFWPNLEHIVAEAITGLVAEDRVFPVPVDAKTYAEREVYADMPKGKWFDTQTITEKTWFPVALDTKPWIANSVWTGDGVAPLQVGAEKSIEMIA